MAYANITFAELKALLKKRVGGATNFWVEHEFEIALNEALSIWQVLVGEFSTWGILDQSDIHDEVTALYTPESGITLIVDESLTRLALPLSVWRVGTYTSTSTGNLQASTKLVQASVPEYDYGYPGWRTGVATTPDMWAPCGLNKIVFSPRPAADLRLDYYTGDRLLNLEEDSVQLGDEELNRLLDYAVWQLNIKCGTEEAFTLTQPLKELFLVAARLRNQKLRGSQLYKDYMGNDRGETQPSRDATPQSGGR